MIKNIKNIFFLILFLSFIVFTTFFYFSDINIRETNKNRAYYSTKTNVNLDNLPLLKSDTNDIVEYKNDIEIYKKKKRYKFWDLIKNNF